MAGKVRAKFTHLGCFFATLLPFCVCLENNGSYFLNELIKNNSFSGNNDVAVFDVEEFDKKMLNSLDPYIVVLHGNELAKEWSGALPSFRGLVGFALIRSPMTTHDVDIATIYHYGNEKVKLNNAKVTADPKEARYRALSSIPDASKLLHDDIDIKGFIEESYGSYRKSVPKFPVFYLYDDFVTGLPLIWTIRVLSIKLRNFFQFAVRRSPKPADFDILKLTNKTLIFPAILAIVKDEDTWKPVVYDQVEYGPMEVLNIMEFLADVNANYQQTLTINTNNRQLEIVHTIAEQQELYKIGIIRLDKNKATIANDSNEL